MVFVHNFFTKTCEYDIMKDIKTEDLSHLNDHIDIGLRIPSIHTDTIDGILQQKAFRVVTEDLKSLGLRNNPNILQYEKGAWKRLPESEQLPGKSEWAGSGSIAQ